MYSPIDSSTPAFCHHVHLRTTGSTNALAGVVDCAGSTAPPRRWTSTVAAAIEATPTSEPCIGRRLPKRMMTKKATPGITGISQAFSRNQAAAIIARHLAAKPHFHKRSGQVCTHCSVEIEMSVRSSGRQPFISLSSSRAIERRLR